MNETIKQILEKKTEDITAEETLALDAWLTNASYHDCDNNPSDRHCAICFFAVKTAKKMEYIEDMDTQRESDIEQALLETEGERATI